MKKIVFPTDFSETANNAFIYALKLADSIKAQLFILHTYEMPVISSTSAGQPELIQEVYNSIELNQFENYKEKTPEMRKMAEENGLGHVPMNFLFEEGTLLYAINHIVEEEKIDFVVMGTNGASGFEKKLLGSNTVNVIRSLKIPVLSVPHQAKFRGLNTIGFTTLFKEADKQALQEIMDIAEVLDARVKVLHVMKEENEATNQTVTQWEQFFNNNRLSFYTVLNQDLEESVFYFMDQHDIDILAMVRRNRNFFDRLFGSSLTKKLTYHSKEPIMVLHELKS